MYARVPATSRAPRSLKVSIRTPRSTMVAALLAMSVLLALGGAGGASAAKLPRARVGTTDFISVFSDGTRFAAWTDGGTVTVVDDELGHTRTLSAPACDDPATRSELQAVGDGQLLWECAPRTASAYPVLQDAVSGAESRPAFDPHGSPFEPSSVQALTFTAIGARWIAGQQAGYHYHSGFYVDRRTGAIREDVTPRRRRALDLDRRSLTQPLCSPLRRSGPRTAALRPGGFLYASPFGIDRRSVDALVLQRCGHRRSVTVSRCRTPCLSVQLTSDVLSWYRGVWERAYLPRQKVRFRVRAGHEVLGLVVHTRAALYFVGSDPAFLHHTVWRAALPQRP